MKHLATFMLPLSMMLFIAACSGEENNTANDNEGTDNDEEQHTQSEEQNGTNEMDDSQSIEVELTNIEGDSVGTAMLKQVEDGVKVTLNGHDLPVGTHAFHIHETGKCEAPDFESAGDHFNPEDKNHGFDDPDGPHAGDMPNIEVDEDGKVEQSFVAEQVTLEKGEDHSLLDDGGTSLVIHEGEDDGKHSRRRRW